MNEYPFGLVENDRSQVIIKNNAKTSLDVARHPYVSSDYDYITVTKGKEHILTVVKEDGTTFSFDWGENGYTLISKNCEMLKHKVLSFLNDQGITLGARTTARPCDATICYNNNYKKWQAWFKYPDTKDEDYFFSENANDVQEFLSEIRNKFNPAFGELQHSVAQSGTDLWKCKEEN